MDDSGGLTDAPIKVFLVDDHELVRRGLANVLGEAPDVVVVGEAGCAAEALARIPAAQPHVALVDGRLPDASGAEVCRDIVSSMPDVRCLILTAYADDETMMAALMAGAAGYLSKDVVGVDLVDAVRRTASGHTVLPSWVARRVAARLRAGREEDARRDALTAREHEVLILVADGLTNRQIAERLFLSEKTVKNYVSTLLAKLGVQRRIQAAVYGAQLRHRY